MSQDYSNEHNIMNSWIDGIIQVDAEGVIVHLNASCSALIGWDLDEVEGKHIHDVLCSRSVYTDHTKEVCDLWRIEESVTHQPVECYWTHKDHSNVAVSYRKMSNQDGVTIIFNTSENLGVQVDELKKLSTFTEINPAPLLELDDQAQIQFSNPAMTELMLEFGFNEEGVPNVLPAEVASIVEKVLVEHVLVDGVESLAVDDEDVRNVRYFLWSFHEIEGPQGASVLLCGIDITSKKEMEIQRKVYEKSIEEEKKQARKEYLAKMVHELRSPLNAVVGYANILKKKLSIECDEKQLLLFDRIIDGGNQLAEQISATLDSSRVEVGKMKADIEHFDALPLVKEVFEKTQSMAIQKGLEISYEFPDYQLKLLADQQHLRQIIINLVSNAIKYTDKGSIVIEARNAVDPIVGRCAVISVTDTGCGVSEAQQEDIFGLYNRQDDHKDSNIEGTGLGLAICVEMIELSHGRITLESQEGKGSTFTALFPR